MSRGQARTRFVFLFLTFLIGPTLFAPASRADDTPPTDPLLLMIKTAASVDGGRNLLPVLETAVAAQPARKQEFTDYARTLVPDRVAEINQAVGFAARPVPAAAVAPTTAAPKAAAKETVKSRTDQAGFFAFSAWDGEVDVGGTLNTGNTDSKAFAGSVKLSHAVGLWRHKIAASFDYGRNSGVLTKQRLLASYQLNYETDDRIYAFGRTEYENDKFSGFGYRVYAGAGLGYRLFNNDAFQWSVEAGPGGRYVDTTDIGASETDFILRTASSLKWLIFPSTVLSQDTEYLLNHSDTLNTTTALTFALTDKLSGRLSFIVRNDSNPPSGAVNTDTTTKASIVYGF